MGLILAVFSFTLLGQNTNSQNQKGKLPTFAPVSIVVDSNGIPPKADILPPLFVNNLKSLLEGVNLFRDVVSSQDARYIIRIKAYEQKPQGCAGCLFVFDFPFSFSNIFIEYSFKDSVKNKTILNKTNNPPIRKYDGFEKSEASKIFQNIKEALKQYRPTLFEITNNPSICKDITIAILPFSSSGQKAKNMGLGETFTAMLTTYFTSNKWLEVVEREEIKKILTELKIGYTGLIVSSTIKKAGRMLGANYFITGTVSELGDKIEVDIKIIDVETGEIVFSDYDNISDIKKLRFLAEDSGYKMLEYFTKHKK